MWLDEADGFSEIFRGYLPYYLLVALPIFIIISPAVPVAASHEFSAYRMQQYDLHTEPHGCRSASFNLEGRSLKSWSTSRHCVVGRVQDITIDQFIEIRAKGGALLLVLPKDSNALTTEEKENIQLLEMAMNQQEMTAPVYFLHWSPQFEEILNDLEHGFSTNDKSSTAFEALLNSVSSNGYQMVVTAPTPQRLEAAPTTLHGKLAGSAAPTPHTILIAAHYSADSLAPELAQGADSNASGAVAVIELARIFSRLYATAATRGGPSLLFVLTSTGPMLNYYAAKRWLEEQMDSTESSLLQDVSFAMNLESISSAGPLGVQVSRPPRGAADSFVTRLRAPFTHKKINLADERLAWQHERFSIRRMTAFTLTTLQSHKEPSRSSFLDVYSEESLDNLVKNIERTARALASHIYNLTNDASEEDSALYDDALSVDAESVRHWYRYLASQPRAPQLLAAVPPQHGVTGALERVLSRYVETTVSVHALDKREPDFALYSPTRAMLYVYNVKPAVFDLILTLAIVAYLGVVYLAMQLFPRFYDEFAKIAVGKTKSN